MCHEINLQCSYRVFYSVANGAIVKCELLKLRHLFACDLKRHQCVISLKAVTMLTGSLEHPSPSYTLLSLFPLNSRVNVYWISRSHPHSKDRKGDSVFITGGQLMSTHNIDYYNCFYDQIPLKKNR